jgi:hypothetical protein
MEIKDVYAAGCRLETDVRSIEVDAETQIPKNPETLKLNHSKLSVNMAEQKQPRNELQRQELSIVSKMTFSLRFFSVFNLM